MELILFLLQDPRFLSDKQQGNENKKLNQFCKLMIFSFVFSPIHENRTISPHTSILTKNVFLFYFKSQISQCPDLRGILPPFLTHIIHLNSFNKQMFLTHLLMMTLYNQSHSKQFFYVYLYYSPCNFKSSFVIHQLKSVIYSENRQTFLTALKKKSIWTKHFFWRGV